MSFAAPRTVTLTPNLIQAINSLAASTNINLDTLDPELLKNNLRAAQNLAVNLQSLEDHGDEISDVRMQLEAQEQALTDAQTQIREQRETICVLTTAASGQPAAHNNNQNENQIFTEKFPDPDKFDGTRSKLRGFLGQLRLKLGDDRRFPTDQDKLRYAASRLEGAALDQILPHLNNTTVDLTNLADLITILENAFDDPDREGTARRHLASMKQGNRDFASYYAEFQRYAPETGWDDAAKRFHLQQGIAREIQAAMLAVPLPNTIGELVTLYQQVDQNIRRLNNTPKTWRSSNNNTSNTTMPSTATGTHPGPMDLSGIKRKLTTEEKVKRMREGRCLYCGGLGHMAKDCPNKGAQRMKANETVINEISGNVESHA